MECPPTACDDPILSPGDCCPRCHNDPCAPLPSSNTSGQPCTYAGRLYDSGSHWNDPYDKCTACNCKVSSRVVIEPQPSFLHTLKTRLTSTRSDLDNQKSEELRINSNEIKEIQCVSLTLFYAIKHSTCVICAYFSAALLPSL